METSRFSRAVWWTSLALWVAWAVAVAGAYVAAYQKGSIAAGTHVLFVTMLPLAAVLLYLLRRDYSDAKLRSERLIWALWLLLLASTYQDADNAGERVRDTVLDDLVSAALPAECEPDELVTGPDVDRDRVEVHVGNDDRLERPVGEGERASQVDPGGGAGPVLRP